MLAPVQTLPVLHPTIAILVKADTQGMSLIPRCNTTPAFLRLISKISDCINETKQVCFPQTLRRITFAGRWV